MYLCIAKYIFPIICPNLDAKGKFELKFVAYLLP